MFLFESVNHFVLIWGYGRRYLVLNDFGLVCRFVNTKTYSQPGGDIRLVPIVENESRETYFHFLETCLIRNVLKHIFINSKLVNKINKSENIVRFASH